MRPIDADALKAKLKEHHDFFIKAWEENGVDRLSIPIPDKSRIDEIDNCIAEIVNAPTVPLPDFKEGYKQAIRDGKTNFSRPHGEWVEEAGKIPHCSICGTYSDDADREDGGFYCTHCGAYMRGNK